MAYETLIVELEDHVATIRLNRPDALNALNTQLMRELGDALTEMDAANQFILTISEKGYGKRTSSFEYRVTGRGGKGIVAMVVNERNGKLVASFPALDSDQLMLVTDGGQLIRVPVDAGPDNRIRIAGR